MKISKDELTFVFLADRQDAISTVEQWYYQK
jgi:hypothetical protein